MAIDLSKLMQTDIGKSVVCYYTQCNKSEDGHISGWDDYVIFVKVGDETQHWHPNRVCFGYRHGSKDDPRSAAPQQGGE